MKKLSFKIIYKITKTLIYMVRICSGIIFQEQNFLVLFPYLIEMMTWKSHHSNTEISNLLLRHPADKQKHLRTIAETQGIVNTSVQFYWARSVIKQLTD